MSTSDKTGDGTVIEDTNVPTHFLDVLADRRAVVKLALKLDKAYEFAFDATKSKVKLMPDKPLTAHSWTDHRSEPGELINIRLGRGKDDVIQLHPGVTTILGKSGSGKTRTAFKYMFSRLNANEPGSAHYIRLFEPGNEAEYIADNVSVPTFEVEAAASIAQLLLVPTVRTIFVDSFRYLFYGSSGGATGKGGVNMSLFMDLTHLDSVARSLGKSIVVVINPMTDDDAAFNFYLEAAVGAVTSVLTMDDYLSARFTSRENANRAQRAIRLAAEPVDTSDRRSENVTMNVGRVTKTNLFDRTPKGK